MNYVIQGIQGTRIDFVLICRGSDIGNQMIFVFYWSQELTTINTPAIE